MVHPLNYFKVVECLRADFKNTRILRSLKLIMILSFLYHSSFLLAKTTAVTPELDGLRLSRQGPNCWNAALIKAGLAHAVRYVPKGEYWFWMKSPYCRELRKDEKPQKGDLGSLMWKGHGHYHSFVYLDDQKVFSKNSPDPKYPYKVQSFEEMFFPDQQAKIKKCWSDYHNRGQQPCEFSVVFHRCRPLEKNFYDADPRLTSWDQKLGVLERQVFSWAVNDSTVSEQEYAKVIHKLYRILHEIRELEKQTSSHKLNKFRLEALEFRVLGLLLADTKISAQIPSVFPMVNYAYYLQEQKKEKILE